MSIIGARLKVPIELVVAGFARRPDDVDRAVPTSIGTRSSRR
jgi:hypothetical protein